MSGRERELGKLRQHRSSLRQIAVDQFNTHPANPERATDEAKNEINVKFGGILGAIAPSVAIKFVAHLIANWAIQNLTVAPHDVGEPLEMEDAG